MAEEVDPIKSGILGDINPEPAAREHQGGDGGVDEEEDVDQSMNSGSHDEGSKHAGSRDVTPGGAGTETGGTRNYRTGTGASGGDIGNRPE